MKSLCTLLLCLIVATQALSQETSSALDPRFQPPPPPERTLPKWVIATGAVLVAVGLTGIALKPSCRTYNARHKCVDPYAGEAVYPALVIMGFGTTFAGSYWYRASDTTKGQTP